MIESDTFLKLLNIQTITKNISLKRGETVFQEAYTINLEDFKFKDYFYSRLPTEEYKIKHEDELKKEEVALFKKLDEDKLNEILMELLKETIKKYETKVSFWKPEKEYLITEPINLQIFKNNPFAI